MIIIDELNSAICVAMQRRKCGFQDLGELTLQVKSHFEETTNKRFSGLCRTKVSLLTNSTEQPGHNGEGRYVLEDTHLVTEQGPRSRQQKTPMAGHDRPKLRAADDEKHGTLIAFRTAFRQQQNIWG